MIDGWIAPRSIKCSLTVIPLRAGDFTRDLIPECRGLWKSNSKAG